MPSFKELAQFFVSVGADKVPHTETVYLAHAIGVHNDLQAWGCGEEVCELRLGETARFLAVGVPLAGSSAESIRAKMHEGSK